MALRTIVASDLAGREIDEHDAARVTNYADAHCGHRPRRPGRRRDELASRRRLKRTVLRTPCLRLPVHALEQCSHSLEGFRDRRERVCVGESKVALPVSAEGGPRKYGDACIDEQP